MAAVRRALVGVGMSSAARFLPLSIVVVSCCYAAAAAAAVVDTGRSTTAAPNLLSGGGEGGRGRARALLQAPSWHPRNAIALKMRAERSEAAEDALFAADGVIGYPEETISAKKTISSGGGKTSSKAPRVVSWQAAALKEYAIDNRVVITICNFGMGKDWLQQWYVSAWRAGVRNLIVVAADEDMYDWGKSQLGTRVIHFGFENNVTASGRWEKKKESNSSAAVGGHAFGWRSPGYERVVTQRASILREIMDLGYDVLYSDTDIHWFESPFGEMDDKYKKCDLSVQREKSDVLGDYNCSGFFFFRNSWMAKIFVALWELYIMERLKTPGFFTDQTELNHLLTDLAANKITVKGAPKSVYDLAWSKQFTGCTLAWDQFPSGVNYFSKRGKGKGKQTADCMSSMCKGLIWKPLTYTPNKKTAQRTDLKPLIVHHNFIKSNTAKMQRAKDFGFWLPLKENTWV